MAVQLTPVKGNPFATYTPVAGDPFTPAQKAPEPGLGTQVGGEALGALEAATNLASASVAPVVAGLAGLGTMATNEAGLTHTPASDVVHELGSDLTYAPRTPQGKRDTAIVNYPFEKLAEAGQYAGGKTLSATGSPVAATAVDTAINALPLVLPGAVKGARGHLRSSGAAAEGVADRAAEPSAPATEASSSHPTTQETASEPAPQATAEATGLADATPVHYTPVADDPFAKTQAPLAQKQPPDQRSIVTLAERVRNEATAGKKQSVQFDGVSPAAAQVLRDQAGLDASAFVHEIDDSSIRHAFKRHGDELAERQRGQQAITAEDFAHVPAVVRHPDRVDYTGTTHQGLPVLRYYKRINGHVVVVEEARTGRKKLSLVTMWKTRAAPDAPRSSGSSAPTSATFGRDLPPGGADPQGRVVNPDTLDTTQGQNPTDTSIIAPAGRRYHDRAAAENGEPPAIPDEGGDNGGQSLQKVFERKDGTRYYDHGFKRKPAMPGTEIGGTDQVRAPDSGEPSVNSIPYPADKESPQYARQNMTAGENYVGLSAEHAVPEATPPTGKPISRQDVLRPFLKALGARVYEGRVKGRGTLGFYLPKKEAVRIKRRGDLEVTAHEIAHLVDDRTPEIRQALRTGPQASTYRQELQGVSYDSKSVTEGFAEFVRLWMTQPEEAAKRAPAYNRWFDAFVERAKIGPALKQARGAMQDWYHQSDLQRARSKVGVQKPINAALDGLWDRFRQSVADDLHGVYRMERHTRGTIAHGGAYETARLTRSAYTQAERALVEGHPVKRPDGTFAFEGQGLQQILDPVAGDLDNFLLYALGRSSEELMSQGRENLFTPTEIRAMKRLETPAFERAFDEYQAWNRAILDFAESMGIINPASRKLWRRAQYLPMYRVDHKLGGRKAQGIEGNWNGIHRLTGGSGNVRDVLGNMMQNATRLIVDSIKNEARQEIAKLADTQRGGGRFMVKIARDTKPISVDKAQIRDFVYHMLGLDKRAVDAGNVPPEALDQIQRLEAQFDAQADFIQFWLHGQAPKGDNVVAVMHGGKPTFYEVADPLLYRAIASLNRPARSWFTTFLNYPKRIGQASVTLTLDFMLRNIARDTLMGWVMTKNGFRPVMDSVAGMKSRITRDPAYREAMANGVGLASYLTDEKAFRKHLERFYNQKGMNARYILDAPEKIAYGLETIADAFETATRLGEYKRARTQGATPRQAAYQAREVSTDFAMRGDSQVLGFMYDTVMFLKPMINSVDRLYRGLAHDEQWLSIAAKTGALATVSAALYLYNRSIQQYQDLPDWDKDLYWHFFIPGYLVPWDVGDYLHLRMPKLWEIGAVSSLSERTMEHIVADDPDHPLWQDSARILLNLFYVNGIPQALAPLYEQGTNRISFTGTPIENLSEQSLAPWARSDAYTPRTLRALGKLERHLPRSLQLSPDRTEALLRGYFNTWALYGLTLTDAALFDGKPDLRTDEYPVIRSFYEGEPARHSKYANQFYAMLKAATEARRTMRAMAKRGAPDIVSELAASGDNARYQGLTHVNERLQALNREMKRIYDRQDLTPKQKRTRLDQLQGQRNALMKLAVQQYRKQP